MPRGCSDIFEGLPCCDMPSRRVPFARTCTPLQHRSSTLPQLEQDSSQEHTLRPILWHLLPEELLSTMDDFNTRVQHGVRVRFCAYSTCTAPGADNVRCTRCTRAHYCTQAHLLDVSAFPSSTYLLQFTTKMAPKMSRTTTRNAEDHPATRRTARTSPLPRTPPTE